MRFECLNHVQHELEYDFFSSRTLQLVSVLDQKIERKGISTAMDINYCQI